MQSPLLGSNQCFGDLGKGELLNGDQHFLLGRIDLPDQLFFKVVAVAPLAGQGTAVSSAVSMIEVQLNVLG